jgi:hypothetical protein
MVITHYPLPVSTRDRLNFGLQSFLSRSSSLMGNFSNRIDLHSLVTAYYLQDGRKGKSNVGNSKSRLKASALHPLPEGRGFPRKCDNLKMNNYAFC